MSIANETIMELQGAPQSNVAERTVLGAMMVDQIAAEDAMRTLQPEDLYLDSHRRIYSAITAVVSRQMAVDIITVSHELDRRKDMDAIGGPGYLASLSEGLPRRLSITNYVQIIRDKSLLRRTMSICEQSIHRCLDGREDPLAIVNDAARDLSTITERLIEEVSLEDQVESEFEQLMRERQGERVAFVPCGIASYEESHGGFAVGETTVIAARPNIGKSPMLRQAVIANCNAGNFVHLFSPEMSAGQIHRALWASIANVPFYKVRFPEKLTERDLHYLEVAKKIVSGWPLRVDDTAKITATELIAKARYIKKNHNTKLLGVDYLQKLSHRGKSENRHVDLTDAMVALTGYAKTEQIALVLVSSLTEPSGKEKNRIPTIDDLRQSGDIKYEAHTILLLHRERDVETQKLAPETQLIVGKARANALGSRTIYFDGSAQEFIEQHEFMRRMGR